MKKYTFTPAHYLKHRIDQLESTSVSDEVILTINKEVAKRDIKTPTEDDIKTIVRELKLYKYYECISTIHKIINGGKKIDRVVLDEAKECHICFEEITNAIKLECKHLFCDICVKKIAIDNSVKCPLCRQLNCVIDLYRLSDTDRKIILDEFDKTKDLYKIGNNFLPFDEILKEICRKNGLKTCLSEN